MGRAPCCDKVGLKRGRWTAEEDEILLNYIKVNGEGSWRAMPRNAGLLRCGKSCRLRWINYLRDDLKRGNISKEEEEMIIKLHATMGNRWSLIASHLPGRTDNEIKNYWNSHLSRRVDSFIRTNEKGTTSVVGDIGKLASVGKRRGGRTSRSAMKKTSLYSKSIRRENESKSGSNIPPSSSVQSVEGSNMLLDLGLDKGLLGFEQEIREMLLSPTSQLIESRIWEDVECEELFGANEERESGVMSSSEERVGGVLAEGEMVSLKEEGDGADKVGKMVEWDLEGLREKLWDDEGYMWSWAWDDGRGDLDFQSVEESGYKGEMIDAWLVSDM